MLGPHSRCLGIEVTRKNLKLKKMYRVGIDPRLQKGGKDRRKSADPSEIGIAKRKEREGV